MDRTYIMRTCNTVSKRTFAVVLSAAIIVAIPGCMRLTLDDPLNPRGPSRENPLDPENPDSLAVLLGLNQLSLAGNAAGYRWQEATASAGFSARYGLSSAVIEADGQRQMLVVAGVPAIGALGTASNDVWLTTDGINWVGGLTDFSGRGGASVSYFAKKLYLFGGAQDLSVPLDDVYTSTNGVQWIPEPQGNQFSARFLHTSVVFQDKIFLIAGAKEISGVPVTAYGDLWYSSDGVTWTQQDNPGFSPRYGHTTVVFDNKMWMIGGLRADTVALNEVWFSSDPLGAVWQQVPPENIPFPGRFGHVSLVYDGKIWVIGGSDQTSVLNDVYSSSNGINWTQVRPGALPFTTGNYPGRTLFTGIVFNDAMWIMGGAGNTQAGELRNDVWYTTGGTGTDAGSRTDGTGNSLP